MHRSDHPASAHDTRIVEKMLADVKFAASYRASGDIAALRAATARMIDNPFFRPMPSGVRVTPAELDGLRGEWIEANPVHGEAALIFFHGGGYVRGSLDLGRANAAEIARRSGLPVFAPAYAQGPERMFPAAVQDAVAAARAIARSHRRFALVGESSGGGLVLSTAMSLRELGAPMPFATSAISPFVDLTLSGESWDFNAGKDIATREMGADMIAIYMGDHDRRDWRASPVYGDFARLGPLQIIVGSHEGLFSEALTAAQQAGQAGSDVSFEVFEGMPHGFTKYRFEAADAAMDRVGGWLAAQASAATPT